MDKRDPNATYHSVASQDGRLYLIYGEVCGWHPELARFDDVNAPSLFTVLSVIPHHMQDHVTHNIRHTNTMPEIGKGSHGLWWQYAGLSGLCFIHTKNVWG